MNAAVTTIPMSARPARTVDSTAASFGTGSAPGKPRHGYVVAQGSSSTFNLVSVLPRLEQAGNSWQVTVRDLLTGGDEIVVPADLVVLAVGIRPRADASWLLMTNRAWFASFA